jgi:hypothetical protein
VCEIETGAATAKLFVKSEEGGWEEDPDVRSQSGSEGDPGCTICSSLRLRSYQVWHENMHVTYVPWVQNLYFVCTHSTQV